MNQRREKEGQREGEREPGPFYPGSHGFEESRPFEESRHGATDRSQAAPYSQDSYARDPFSRGDSPRDDWADDQYAREQPGGTRADQPPAQQGRFGRWWNRYGPGAYSRGPYDPGQDAYRPADRPTWRPEQQFGRPYEPRWQSGPAFGSGQGHGPGQRRWDDYGGGRQLDFDETYGWESGRGYGGGVDDLGVGGREGGPAYRHGQPPYGQGYEEGYGQRGYGPPVYRQRYRQQYEPQPYGYGQSNEYGPRYRPTYRPGPQSRAYEQQAGRRAQQAHEPSDHERLGYHHSEELFGRRPFAYEDEPPYFGTGSPGAGGTGFTGGAYTYGEHYPEMATDLEGSEYLYGHGPYGYEHGPHEPPGWSSGPQRLGGQGRFRVRTAGRGRMYPPGPKGYQRSDERLREDISERLMQAEHIDSSDVSVEVKGAKVVLDGTVPSRHMKHAIEDLVDACPGVQDIDNRIRVVSDRSTQNSQSTAGQSQTGRSGPGVK